VCKALVGVQDVAIDNKGQHGDKIGPIAIVREIGTEDELDDNKGDDIKKEATPRLAKPGQPIDCALPGVPLEPHEEGQGDQGIEE